MPLVQPKKPVPLLTWTAAELMATEFPEPRWAIPGVIAEGLNLLAGAPKVGKSWAGIGVAVAVATGGIALGRIPVEAGDVLYLALEDTRRRLKDRLRKVIGRDAPPERLTLATTCSPLPDGGAEQITGWLEQHPTARLVIIDVLTRIRGSTSSSNGNQYDADYQAMAGLKELADRYGVAFLVLHHTRKSAADDFLDTVSGTQGLAGAADAVLVLSRGRGEADGVLALVGRDIEEATYALKFAPDLGAWQLLEGPATDYTVGDTRRQILELLRRFSALTPTVIGEWLDVDVKATLWRMAQDGQLHALDGHYSIPEQQGVPREA